MPTRPDVVAREAADHVHHHPLETLGRVGYAVKGGVYVLMGILAVAAARGGGETDGQKGALHELAGTPFGGVLLTIAAIGLAAYALWRVALALLDPEGEGSDGKGLATRAFYLLSAASYGTLAYTAVRVLQGASESGGGTESRTATLLSQPAGPWLVGLVGLGVVAYGGREFYRAYTASFMDKLALSGEAAARRSTVRHIGQAGLSARGVVYAIIGAFLVVAAWQSDPEEAKGLDEALSALRDQSFGPVLLGLVALGLIAYGLYCWVNARYRRFEGAQ